jgi:Carboxypeptidase regulatory-like domain/TonB dependent receptor
MVHEIDPHHNSGFSNSGVLCRRCAGHAMIGASILLLAFLCIQPSPMAAQSFTASLEGTVTDPSDAIVPDVDVTLINELTGVKQVRKSDNRGYFLFTLVPPGSYSLTAASSGFQNFERKQIQLQVQQQANVDVRLTVSGVASSVAVGGEAPRLDTADATLGRVVDRTTMLALPQSDNNALNLVFLAAGVTAPLAPGLGWTGSNFVSNGSRQAMSDVLVDGVTSALHEQNGGATDIKYRPTVENIEELKVQTNSFSAEYGFTGGTVVNMVSRSGTNQFHGDLYETLQNSVLNANDFFANSAGRPLVPSRQNLFGGTLGGPILIPHVYNGHNKTFFFFSQEWTKETSQITTLETHPTALQLQGNFSQTLDQNGKQIPIYDPNTAAQNAAGAYLRSPFPSNIIPVSRFSPVAAATIPLYPAPNTPGVPFTNANNFFDSGSETYNAYQTSFKVDHNFNDQQRLSGRFSRTYAATQAPHFWGAGDIAESTGGWGWHYVTDNAVIDYTNTLSPTTVLNLRWGLTRYQQHSTPSCGDCAYNPSALGFTGPLDAQLPPQFNPSGYTSLFPAGSQQIIQAEDVNHLVANLTKVTGRHTMKIGAEARLYRLNYGQPGVDTASFAFTRQGTGQNPLVVSNNQGDGFASFLLGWGTGTQTTDLRSAWAYKSYGFFYQDDIHVTRDLTVNLGLRYELPTAETERYNRVSWFNPGIASPLAVPGLPNLMGGLQFGDSSNRSPFDTPKKNFAPRIGFAWQLLPGTVLRGGYGIFDGLSAAQDRSPLGTGFKTSTVWNQSLNGGITQYNALNNPFPTGVNVPPGSSQGLLTNVGQSLGSSPIRYWDTTPYFQQWSLSIQRQLPLNSVLEVAYSGNRGVHLVFSGVSNIDAINQSYYSLGTGLNQLVTNPFYGTVTNPSSALSQPTVQLIQLLRPYPQFTSVSGAPGPPIGNSTYHSMQVKYTKRYSNGLNFNFRYTFSKMIDDTSANGTVTYLGGASTVQNYNDLRLEKAVSLLDITHLVGADFTYQLPIGRGKLLGNHWNRAEDMILGGWQVNGNLTFHTGVPLVPMLASGTLPDANQRPNLLSDPGVPGSPESKLNQYVNPAAFSIPAAYSFGSAPRTISQVRAPGLADADMSLFKYITFSEDHHRSLQIKFEVFNVTNTPFFAAPNMSVGSSSFGVISSTNGSAQGTPGFFGAGPRQMQVGLKLNF